MIIIDQTNQILSILLIDEFWISSMMNLSYEQLNTFKTVMEMGSFSAAARQLGKVPSAVSMAMSNLEIDLDLNLFERVGREPKPTTAALQLYQQTLELLAEMHRWQQYATHLHEQPEANLCFAVVSEVVHLPWTHLLDVLAKQFPALGISIISTTQEQVLSLLAEGKAQFALMFEREQYTAMEQFIEIGRERLVPIAAPKHPLAAKRKIELSSLRQHRQIVIGRHHDHTDSSAHSSMELIFSKSYWLTDSQLNALQMIQQGLGWGVLPLSLLEQYPTWQQDYQILDLHDFSPNFDYFVDLVWRHDAAIGIAGHFLINHIKSSMKK